MAIYEIIKSLQSAQGNIAKQAILDDNKDNELLKAYMKATYDPSISYYQTKIPKGPYNWNLDWMDSPEYPNYLLEGVQELASRKVTGKAAINSLLGLYSSISPEGKELLTLLIDRSIGASVGDKMVLKTWPGLYFVPPYQRCSLLDTKTRKKFLDKKFYVQIKKDGSFAYAFFRADGSYDLITRAGNTYPQEFAQKFCHTAPVGGVVVGELEVYDEVGKLLDRKTGNGILNSIQQGGELPEGYEVVMDAWDMLYQEEFEAGKSVRPYSTRLESLQNWLIREQAESVTLIENWEVESMEEALAIYQSLTARGLEGAILKLFESLWKDGTATDIVKLKLRFEVEMRCTGIYEGEGKAKGMMGGANLESQDGKIKNNCGTGFSDKQRKEFWANPELIVQQAIAVEANDIIVSREEGSIPSLSLPVFIEVRYDKKGVADTYERIVAQHEAAKQGA